MIGDRVDDNLMAVVGEIVADGLKEQDKTTESPKPLTLEEQLATWTKRVPSRGPMIILNPHPNLVEQIRKLNDKKAHPDEEES